MSRGWNPFLLTGEAIIKSIEILASLLRQETSRSIHYITKPTMAASGTVAGRGGVNHLAARVEAGKLERFR